MLAEQSAVRQIGEWIIVRQMRDPLLRAFPLRDVLVGCDPATFLQRLVHDLNRSTVGRFNRHFGGAALRQILQDGFSVGGNVAVKRIHLLPMTKQIGKRTARPYELWIES